MAVDLDLTHFLKETQLQHGLRAEDYVRYHHYLTNRLATLRKQLNLSNDKKKFLNKDVTTHNATDPRHFMLLSLYAERCWASAEVMMERSQKMRGTRGEGNRPRGGVAPSDQHRKRLNKALKWATKLSAVAEAVGSPRLQKECLAYMQETAGRTAAAHGQFTEAKRMFVAARQAYFELRVCSDEEQWGVVLGKVSELDDRVVYCMQQLGEDVRTYEPPMDLQRQQQLPGSTTLDWNGRVLTVTSIKVKDALREARAVSVEVVLAKALENPTPVAVGQVNKVLDHMDRRVNYYNDALSHARQDLRAAPEGKQSVERQLIVHYLLFHATREMLRRTLFLADVYSRRFHSTEKALRSSTAGGGKQRKSEVSAAQYASPLEVVRLYGAAAEAVGEMELLPGAAGREDVEALAALSLAGKLLYTGESWRVAGDSAAANECYCSVLSVLAGAEGAAAAELYERAERCSLRMSAEAVLASSRSSSSGKGAGPVTAGEEEATVPYLAEAAPGVVAVAQNVVRFPPRYQAVPCKPAFVDIASTYVDFPLEEEEKAGAERAGKAQPTAAAGSAPAPEGGNEKKWGWKWGWNCS